MLIEIGILIRNVGTFNCSGAAVWKLPAYLCSVRINEHTLVVKGNNSMRIDSIIITTYLLFYYQIVL